MKQDRKPKKYIFICHGKDCLKNGAKELHRGLEREIKSVSGRASYQLIKTKCMDHCKDGPSVIVDNIWHGKVEVKDVVRIPNKKAVK